jgi:hypothetical protein
MGERTIQDHDRRPSAMPNAGIPPASEVRWPATRPAGRPAPQTSVFLNGRSIATASALAVQQSMARTTCHQKQIANEEKDRRV